MITQELKQLVVNEALALREHATKEERGRLDFSSINTDHSDLCPYGQMTGDCWSKRTITLLNKCTKPYCISFDEEKNILIRSLKKEFIGFYRDFSPIEFYITCEGAKTEDLIKLIKSNRN